MQSLILSNPTPDSFHLVQTSVIGNGSPYHPNLDAFNASLSLDGRVPYAYIEVPAVHAEAQATTVVDQDVTITDLDAFIDYNINVLQNEEVKLDVKGRTGLHEMSFPTTHVDYDKTATMKGLYSFSIPIHPKRPHSRFVLGLNNLTGFSITNFTIQLLPEPDGTNMLGTVNIPNPTVMTLSMVSFSPLTDPPVTPSLFTPLIHPPSQGNVTFNNYIGNTTDSALYVGTTTLTNLTLVPGNNTIPMRSTVNQSLVLSQIVENYQNGLLPISIVGNSSVFEGQHLVYFEKALSSVTQHVTLDVGKALMEIGVNASALGGGGGLPPLSL